MENFEDSRSSINDIVNGMTSMNAVTLLRLLNIVIREFAVQSNVEELSQLQIGDADFRYAVDHYNLANELNNLFEANRGVIALQSEESKKKLDAAIEGQKQTVLNLEATKASIEDMERESEKLEKDKIALEERRGHLLGLLEECRKFQARIDELSDTRLDTIALDCAKMREKLDEREIRNTELERQANELKIKESSTEAKNKELAENMKRLEESIEKIEKEISATEGKIDKQREHNAELEQQREEFRKQFEPFLLRGQELEAEMAAISNAWKAISNQKFLQENMNGGSGDYATLSLEIEKQSSALAEQVESFRERIEKLARKAEKLTKEAEIISDSNDKK